MNKKIILAAILFTIIFSGLGLFYGHWGLSTDDWGNLWHTMMAKSWKDFGRYFINIELASHTTNYSSPFEVPSTHQAFFCGLLRPLTFVYYWLEVHLFGLNPYALFLVSAAFHAGSCVLLFFIFSAIVPLLWAFLSALFFGFHPSLWIWWGFISPQSYYIELFVLLLIFVCLHKFMQTSHKIFYLIACLLYAHNLLVREQTFFLPFWLIPAFYFYDTIASQTPPRFWKNLSHYIKLSSGFFLVTISYILLRLWLFPLTSNTSTLTFEPTWSSFATRMHDRVFDFVTYIANLFALTVLPQNHQMIKGSLIVLIFTVLTYLLIKNAHKDLVIFLALSVPLFSWPALLMHHQPRYAYMSYPFFIFMLLVLFRYYQGPRIQVPRIIPALALLAFIGVNAYMITEHTIQRQDRMTTVFQALTEVAQNPRTHNRVLFFMGYPPIFNTGLAHAIWLLNDDHTITVHSNSLSFKASSFMGLQENYIDYTVQPNGIMCYQPSTHTSQFVPKEDLCTQENPVYIVWDYKMRRFKILGGTLFKN